MHFVNKMNHSIFVEYYLCLVLKIVLLQIEKSSVAISQVRQQSGFKNILLILKFNLLNCNHTAALPADSKLFSV